MITTEEILRILRSEEIPEEERDNLENLLLERANEALEGYSKDKTAFVQIVTDVKDMVDFIDIFEKMKETGSTDIESLVQSVISDRIEEISGVDSWSECDIK